MMRAQPAERDISILRRSQQKTWPVVLRIRKHLRTTHWNLADLADRRYRERLIPPAQDRDHRAHRRNDNSRANIPGEAPARNGLRWCRCWIFRRMLFVLAHI